MGNLILDPSGNASPIQQPFDKYWDSPMSRREAHTLFMKLASNDNELMGMADTASILINYLCETLKVTREEVQKYVDEKHIQLALAAMRAQMKAEAEAPQGTTNAQSHS